MLFGLELSKLQFRVHNLMNFLIKWITDEAVGVVDATPYGMCYFVKCKTTLNV